MQTRILSGRWGFVALSAVLLAVIAIIYGGKYYRENRLADLERQFTLAVENRDVAAVGEIARRIAELNHTPDRRLDMARTMVELRMFSDAERTLASVLRAAPERRSAVLHLRALAAVAQREPDIAVERWEQLLADPAVANAERVAALDGVTRVFVEQRRWDEAQVRLDRRLGLSDESAARLVRAEVEIRRRRWDQAAADFHYLRTTDPANTAVKAKLPGWERVERSLDALRKCDAAVMAAPSALRPATERALLCLRLGLWQNAVADLQFVYRRVPSGDTPKLLINVLCEVEGIDRRVDELKMEEDFVPWLASSQELAIFGGRFDDRADDWRTLVELDEELATGADGDEMGIAAKRAERARLVCELGQPRQALSEADDLLQSQPGFQPAQRVKIMALYAMGNLREAATEIDVALKANSESSENDPELENLAGLVWQAQGKHAGAVEMFTACMPTLRSPALLRARATSLRFLQRFADAEQDLAEARALEDAARKEARP